MIAFILFFNLPIHNVYTKIRRFCAAVEKPTTPIPTKPQTLAYCLYIDWALVLLYHITKRKSTQPRRFAQGRAAHFAMQNALRRLRRSSQSTRRLTRARPRELRCPWGGGVLQSSTPPCEWAHYLRTAAFRFVRETANAAKAAAPADEGTRTGAAKRSASPFRRRALMKSTHFGGFCYPRFLSHFDKRRIRYEQQNQRTRAAHLIRQSRMRLRAASPPAHACCPLCGQQARRANLQLPKPPRLKTNRE